MKPSSISCRVLVIAAMMLTWFAASAGARTLVISDGRDEYQAASFVQVLIDPTEKMTLTQAVTAQKEKKFLPNNQDRLSMGTVQGALWLFMEIKLPSDHQQDPMILELSRESIEQVDVYFPDPDGTLQHIPAGYHLKPGQMTVFSRYPAVRLPGGHHKDPLPVFIRLKSPFALGMGITIRTREAFHRHQLAESYLFGLLYGVPLALSLFNFFIFLSLRDKAYLHYVIFVSTMATYQAMIHGQIRLMGLFDPGLEISFHGILIGAALFFAALFTKSFLLTRRHAPFMDKVLSAYMVLAVIRFILALAGLHQIGNTLSQIMGLLSPIVSISTGVVCWRSGFKPARYYVLAWSALSVCVVWHVLVSMSILPWIGISSMMMVFGSALESVLLSFALADRIRTLRHEREVAEKQGRQYRDLSMLDSLTGLFNRRYLSLQLDKQVKAADDISLPLSLLFMDIDNFKQYNDAHGHPEGDKVLVRLARSLSQQVRHNDITGRYGGEEFVILMPETTSAEAVRISERIRLAFTHIEFTPAPGVTARVGISIGVAQLGSGENKDDFLQRADQALYQAKNLGRNQTVLAEAW